MFYLKDANAIYSALINPIEPLFATYDLGTSHALLFQVNFQSVAD